MIDYVNSAIATGVEGIFIFSLDPETLHPSIKKAVEKGIKVVTVRSRDPVYGPDQVPLVGFEIEDEGYTLANMGMNMDQMRVYCFILVGILCALAGVMRATRVQGGYAQQGSGMELMAIVPSLGEFHFIVVNRLMGKRRGPLIRRR